MKNIFRNSLIMSLSALLFAGCQQDENLTSATEDKELVTIYANIDGNNASRVIYEDTEGLLKVDWKDSGESFVVVRDNQYKIFTQKSGSKFEFESDGLPGENGDFIAYYPATAYSQTGFDIDFSNQTGQLDEQFSFMSATSGDEKSFTFSHLTAIIKPTFNINDNAVSNSSITKIILKGIVNVKDMMDEGDITVTIPEEDNIDNIYIYLPPKELNSTEIYGAGDIIDMEVYIKENDEEKKYTGKITVPADRSIECGKVYPLGITLSDPVSEPETITCQLPDGDTFKNYIREGLRTDVYNIKFIAGSTADFTTFPKIGDSDAYRNSNSTTHTLEIHTRAKKFKFNSDCSYMFSDLNYLTGFIDFNDCVDTSEVTNMSYMFSWSKIKELDLTCFETSNVKNMANMFFRSSKLETLIVSNFNTQNVETMQSMFNQCLILKELDLKSFDTSQVTTMKSMFYNCNKLESLDIRNFTLRTGVTTTDMFNGVGSLLTDKSTKIIVMQKPNIVIPATAKAMYVDTNGNPL